MVKQRKRALHSISPREIERWITEPRFQPFLTESNGDPVQAMALYDWNVCVSAVFFEVLSYAEVMLRNAIDAQFAPIDHSQPAAQSWLADPALLNPKAREYVAEAITKIEQMKKAPTRARLVANLSFGFWRALLNREYKELWITHLHHGFPNGTGDRAEVAKLMARLNPFRNRIAHHEPIVNASIQKRHDDLVALIGLIDLGAASWVDSRSAVSDVLAWKPPLQGRRWAMGRLGLAPRTARFHVHR